MTRVGWLVAVVAAWLAACGVKGRELPWLTADTPLHPCGSQREARFPQQGRCPDGQFPDIQIACGPPDRLADGGFWCGCRETGPGTCRVLCTWGPDCGGPTGSCEVREVLWGDDIATAQLGLCR